MNAQHRSIRKNVIGVDVNQHAVNTINRGEIHSELPKQTLNEVINAMLAKDIEMAKMISFI